MVWQSTNAQINSKKGCELVRKNMRFHWILGKKIELIDHLHDNKDFFYFLIHFIITKFKWKPLINRFSLCKIGSAVNAVVVVNKVCKQTSRAIHACQKKKFPLLSFDDFHSKKIIFELKNDIFSSVKCRKIQYWKIEKANKLIKTRKVLSVD